MASFTNFLLNVYVAKSLGATQFGAFSLAYVTYGFALNASRGLSIEPLLIRFSGADLKIWRRATTEATGTAVLVGLVTGACALTAAVLMGGTTGMAFLGLGLVLPGLMLQDSWRYAFFAIGRGMHAFVNDTIWAVVQVPLLIALKMTGHANVFWFVIAWGAGGVVAAAFGALQARVMPGLVSSTFWLVRHRDLGPRYLLENAGGNASDTVRGYGTSSILGLAGVGDIQAANVLMGPFKILYFGMGMITIPEATRILRQSPRKLASFSAAVAVGLTVLAVLWTVALLVLMPFGLGQLMLGSIWKPAYPLVLPTALAIIAMCAGTGASVGLHALGAARRSLRSTLIGAAVLVVLAISGAFAAGALGSVYGVAVGAWFGTVLGWWQFRNALVEAKIAMPAWMIPRSTGKHHGAVPVDPRPQEAEATARPH
jgi:O-antigen/teichoic acid export membrane protein